MHTTKLYFRFSFIVVRCNACTMFKPTPLNYPPLTFACECGLFTSCGHMLVSWMITYSTHYKYNKVVIFLSSNQAWKCFSDNFCYCGSDIPYYSLKREDDVCNVQCPDNSSAMCGGDWLMSVYLLDSSTRGSLQPTGKWGSSTLSIWRWRYQT